MSANNPSLAKPSALIADKLLDWFAHSGRHDLPWQKDITPYRVWVSEIMLQQTQVSTVIPYYERFMTRYPTVVELADSPLDQVLHLWTGLGYYARARNMHKAAQTIRDEFNGQLPASVDALMSLSGIGQSTAGAIASLSMNLRAPILDGNVKRVLTRYHAIAGYPEQSAVKQQLWQIAEAETPSKHFAHYTQAIMDLGATVCTRSSPQCDDCPLQSHCKAHNTGTIDLYPGKKPKKSLPVKALTMFVLTNKRGDVLLEKRPPTGIWGSLYSLPESENPAQVHQICGITLPTSGRHMLPPIRHSFSHYHLDIEPILIPVAGNTARIADSDRWLWYPLDHSIEVGLAAPVKKLLTSLQQPKPALPQK